MRIDVAFTPDDVKHLEPSGVCVVVDVLRASSTITTALFNGCLGIYPVSEPSEAFPFADGMRVLACGERNGVKIRGYHLGNSPAEFGKQAVGGKELVMCTTNGTAAIRVGAARGRALIGCFLNAPAVMSILEKQSDDVTIICAGREGDFSIEDALCAGMIVSRLEGQRTDTAVASAAIFREHGARVEEVLFQSQHGRFLQQTGFAGDVGYCARVGVMSVLPEVFASGKPAPHDLVIRAVAGAESLREGK